HAYEVWTPLAHWDRCEDITRVLRQKLSAIRCYASQLALVRYDRAIRGLNHYRGIMSAGKRYAEVFQDLASARPRSSHADRAFPDDSPTGREVREPVVAAGDAWRPKRG